MDKIIPVSELRAKLSETTKWVERKKKPVFLTKNGHGRYVLLDIDSYEKLLTKAVKSNELSDYDEVGSQTSSFADEQRIPRQDSYSSDETGRLDLHDSHQAHEGGKHSFPRGSHSQDSDSGLSEELRAEEEQILKELGLL